MSDHGFFPKEIPKEIPDEITSDDFQVQIHGVTTKIEGVSGSEQYQGTGFYYYYQKTPPSKKFLDGLKKDGYNTEKIDYEPIWFLVTNRHNLLCEREGDEPKLADMFVFYNRGTAEHDDSIVTFEPVVIEKEQLAQITKFHRNEKIDIAVIAVNELVKFTTALSKSDFPQNMDLDVNVGDEVLTAGYPAGYYDENNQFPIVKSGIISSKWGSNYNGLPCFLIDANLFHGSSGSVVITKPSKLKLTHFLIKCKECGMKNHHQTLQSAIESRDVHFNQTKHACSVEESNEMDKIKVLKNKEFAFLGIYSGSKRQEEESGSIEIQFRVSKSLHIGVVWYGYLIEEIFQSGIKFDKVLEDWNYLKQKDKEKLDIFQRLNEMSQNKEGLDKLRDFLAGTDSEKSS